MLFLKKSQSTWIWITCLALIMMLGLWLQSQLFLHRDVSWLMHAAARMLNGGTYAKDFYDPDPPMILYLYSIPVMLSQLFSLSYPVSLRIFVTLLTLLTLMLYQNMGKSLFPGSQVSIDHYFLLVLAAVCLLLPVVAFGQREHLFVILILPYLFAVALRLEHIAIPAVSALLIGVLAGLGFSIKPFFLLAFGLIELFVMLQRQPPVRLWRIETITVSLVVALHLFTIPIFFPDYLREIVPFSYHFFFADYFLQGTTNLILLDIEIFISVVVFIFIIKRRASLFEYILLVALLSGYGIYSIQGGRFLYYHSYPMLAFACLLGFVLFFHWQSQIPKKSHPVLRGSLSLFLVVIIFGLVFFRMTEQYIFHLEDRRSSGRKTMLFIKNNSAFKTCYFISTHRTAYPMVDYVDIKAPSKYYDLAALTTLFYKKSLSKQVQVQAELEREGEFFISDISRELMRIQPDLIFVDMNTSPGYLELQTRIKARATLAQFWKKYQQIPSMDSYQIYVRHTLS